MAADATRGEFKGSVCLYRNFFFLSEILPGRLIDCSVVTFIIGFSVTGRLVKDTLTAFVEVVKQCCGCSELHFINREFEFVEVVTLFSVAGYVLDL